ncbi:MAG: hypothetical protein UU15_C0045G0008, partial [Candidatus Levybacteria bacterium GW2011_GWC2_40_7]
LVFSTNTLTEKSFLILSQTVPHSGGGGGGGGSSPGGGGGCSSPGGISTGAITPPSVAAKTVTKIKVDIIIPKTDAKTILPGENAHLAILIAVLIPEGLTLVFCLWSSAIA